MKLKTLHGAGLLEYQKLPNYGVTFKVFDGAVTFTSTVELLLPVNTSTVPFVLLFALFLPVLALDLSGPPAPPLFVCFGVLTFLFVRLLVLLELFPLPLIVTLSVVLAQPQ